MTHKVAPRYTVLELDWGWDLTPRDRVALEHQARRRILRVLKKQGPQTRIDLANLARVALGDIDYHTTVLRACDMILIEREFDYYTSLVTNEDRVSAMLEAKSDLDTSP
jgi:DNA-binding transcriptional ArsR family regulator